MFVNLWVTTSCNFSCRYCYEGSDKKALFLEEITVNNLINHIKSEVKDENEEIIIEFHGGEPLLNFKIIKYTIEQMNESFPENKKHYGITTNAYYLNEEIADFLAKWIDFNFSISIDGDRETNDKYRVTKDGKGTFDVVKRNAPLLLKKRSDVMARMTIKPDTVKDLYNNCMALVDIGFKVVGSSLDYYDDRWTEDHMDVLYKELLKLRSIQIESKDIRFPITNFYCKKMGVCGFGRKYFNLYPNGDIYPCIFCTGNPNFLIGNINTDEGFNEEKILQLTKINIKENAECIGCSHIQNCICTRCKFMNWSFTGNFFSPSPMVCAMENIKQKISCLEH